MPFPSQSSPYDPIQVRHGNEPPRVHILLGQRSGDEITIRRKRRIRYKWAREEEREGQEKKR
jgi:hypothetical protein